MLKELLQAETQEKEKTYNNKPKTIKKMVIGTYILIITLNANGNQKKAGVAILISNRL